MGSIHHDGEMSADESPSIPDPKRPLVIENYVVGDEITQDDDTEDSENYSATEDENREQADGVTDGNISEGSRTSSDEDDDDL